MKKLVIFGIITTAALVVATVVGAGTYYSLTRVNALVDATPFLKLWVPIVPALQVWVYSMFAALVGGTVCWMLLATWYVKRAPRGIIATKQP
jgi:hypothetical protein